MARSKPAALKYAHMWILQSATPPHDSFTFRLTPGAIKTVGRAARADFIMDAPLVSRIHCRLTATDANVEVVDLKSTNGTFVNDRRVEKATLSPGDRLRVGRVELTINMANGDG
jgi:pSer/pThr/pTyr-binding forkhead associated (FHA) protein